MKLPKLNRVNKLSHKKKILMLSDDCRLKSGVGTMTREIMRGTVHKYDWIQIGGALNHPDAGKGIIDVSSDFQKWTGDSTANVKVLPIAGYGDQDIVRSLLDSEKPDAICHFTDPRFWEWLYAMEHEIRQQIPITYLNIWDDLPYPHWNENAYESCDLLMAISKQTYNINKHVCQRKPRVEEKDLFYVQHGIDENIFKPIDETDGDYLNFKKEVLGDKEKDFVLFFNSRNIRRKSPSDLVLGYRKLCDQLTKEQSSKCVLIMHTDPIDDNGTDLPAVKEALCPEYDIKFSTQKIDDKFLNYMYNLADVTCNPSSAEGFGLSHMESLMAGTPTIATVTGGLQDQMGFKINGEEFSVKHLTADIPSNSTSELSTDHGEWTLPLWPQLNLQGSPKTPYIYDSRASISQITNQLKVWYDRGRQERKRRGLVGRNWAIKNKFNHKGMADAFIKAMEGCFSNFIPRKNFTIMKVEADIQENYPMGELI